MRSTCSVILTLPYELKLSWFENCHFILAWQIFNAKSILQYVDQIDTISILSWCKVCPKAKER